MALLPKINPNPPPIPTLAEIQDMFEVAGEAYIAPFNWIPPTWDEIKDVPGLLLADTSPDLNGFKCPGAISGTAAETRKFVANCSKIRAETDPGEEPDPAQMKWVHPFSDFRHIDPEEFSDDDVMAVKAKTGGTLGAFKRLKQVVGKESRGMTRLARVFQWTLWRATVLLNDINNALEDNSLACGPVTTTDQEAKYNAARERYLAFLTDLDDHEPETKPGPVDPSDPNSRSGYGRAIKWPCIDPVIVGGRIKEARIIVKWNPHVSSSGIAIMH
jgi:hypothetical protein